MGKKEKNRNPLVKKNIQYLIDTTPGMNRSKFARDIGVDRRTVGRWLDEDVYPAQSIGDIAEYFDVPREFLLYVDLDEISDTRERDEENYKEDIMRMKTILGLVGYSVIPSLTAPVSEETSDSTYPFLVTISKGEIRAEIPFARWRIVERSIIRFISNAIEDTILLEQLASVSWEDIAKAHQRIFGTFDEQQKENDK